jgi:hypothetical protein
MDLCSIIEKINSAPFIQPLLPNEEMRILVSCSKQKPILLVLSKGKCFLRSDDSCSLSAHVYITGENSHLFDCFHSPIRLLQLMKLGAIDVKGSFRNILRLESIIQLCK